MLHNWPIRTKLLVSLLGPLLVLAVLALVGIRTRGVPIARRLARALKEINGHDVPTGALDITLYRDDLMRHAVGPQPVVRRTEITFSIDDRKITIGASIGLARSPREDPDMVERYKTWGQDLA